jgi:hypothetical protein
MNRPGVFVLWHPQHPDAATLRAVVAEVRRREAERRARRSAGSAGK